jgi:hypothetical protein
MIVKNKKIQYKISDICQTTRCQNNSKPTWIYTFDQCCCIAHLNPIHSTIKTAHGNCFHCFTDLVTNNALEMKKAVLGTRQNIGIQPTADSVEMYKLHAGFAVNYQDVGKRDLLWCRLFLQEHYESVRYTYTINTWF